MNFTSQICTTKEQSERLMTLGLKRETADMCIDNMGNIYTYPITIIEAIKNDWGLIPLWSLHRLIEMMPSFIEVGGNPFDLEFQITQGKLVIYQNIVEESIGFVWGHGNLYDSIISCIEQLIKEGYFNKEYLEE